MKNALLHDVQNPHRIPELVHQGGSYIAAETAAMREFGAKSTVNTGFGKLIRAPKGSTPLPPGGLMKNFASFSCEPPAKIIELPASLLHWAAKSMQVLCDDADFHSTVSAIWALSPAPKSQS
mmetsp:Transcript_158931/g.509834  ORF Transcript_158931/g.509834 Transcript_158931/m.509834 type:complete len:122 (-) Transcript_158931:902-1267(-)